MRLSTHRLRTDLATGLGTSPHHRRLADGDRTARNELAAAITDYHIGFRTLLPAMERLVHNDLSHRRAVLADGGSGAC